MQQAMDATGQKAAEDLWQLFSKEYLQDSNSPFKYMASPI